MKRAIPRFFCLLLVALMSSVLAFAGTTSESSDDKRVLAVALEDFAKWKEVTFGNIEGILEATPTTTVEFYETGQEIKDRAHEISAHISNALADSYLKRNKSAVSIAALLEGCPFVRVQRSPKHYLFPELPPGVKAFGSLTLPGYSADGTTALVVIYHSWSIHGAAVTYVLIKRDEQWKVLARDQSVHL